MTDKFLLKRSFSKGSKPSERNFSDLIDATYNTTTIQESVDYSYVVVDSSGRASELAIDLEGKIPDNIILAWHNRMLEYGGNSGEIVAWGDSLTAIGGDQTSYISEVGRLSNRIVRNYGVGGETSNTIAARQGGLIMTINNITIPASATQRVRIDSYSEGKLVDNTGRGVVPLRQGNFGINPCYINGVKGSLSIQQNSATSNDYEIYFQRDSNGTAVTINRPTPIITDASLNRRNDIMVIFIGTNGGYTDTDDLISQIRAMIDFNVSLRKEYVVLGLTTGNVTTSADLEKKMTSAFGRRFINLRDYLSRYGMSDLGLTPTQTDTSYINNGSVPPSMLTDTIHHTEATRLLIGRLVHRRMVELGVF